MSEDDFVIEIIVAMSLSVCNFLDCCNERSIEEAASVEISVSIEGFEVVVLDGAVGSVMGECFLVKAAVGSSMQ